MPVLANIKVCTQRIIDQTTPGLPFLFSAFFSGSTCFPHLFLSIPTIQGQEGNYGVGQGVIGCFQPQVRNEKITEKEPWFTHSSSNLSPHPQMKYRPVCWGNSQVTIPLTHSRHPSDPSVQVCFPSSTQQSKGLLLPIQHHYSPQRWVTLHEILDLWNPVCKRFT